MPRLPQRWLLIAPWAIFIAMVLGWTAYWFVLSNQITRQLNGARADLGGYGRLSFGPVETSGFPFRLIAHLPDARLDGPDGAYTLTASRAHVAVNVLNPDHYLVFADGPMRWRGWGLDWTINAARAEASLRRTSDALGETRVALTNARITDAANAASSAALISIGLRRDPADGEARQIAVTMQDFAPALTRGFEGFAGAPWQIKAGLVLEQAALVQPSADPLAAWMAGKAAMRIERFQATRPGMAIAVEGGLSVAADRRPVGAIALTFDDAAAGVAAIAASSTIPTDQRADAAAFAASQGLGGGAAPIALQAIAGRWLLGPAGGGVDLGPAAPLYVVYPGGADGR